MRRKKLELTRMLPNFCLLLLGKLTRMVPALLKEEGSEIYCLLCVLSLALLSTDYRPAMLATSGQLEGVVKIV